MQAIGAYPTGVDENPPTEAPQVSTVVQVPVNIFTGTLQGILGFTSTQVQVLWTMDMTSKSPFFIGNLHILRSGAR